MSSVSLIDIDQGAGWDYDSISAWVAGEGAETGTVEAELRASGGNFDSSVYSGTSFASLACTTLRLHANTDKHTGTLKNGGSFTGVTIVAGTASWNTGLTTNNSGVGYEFKGLAIWCPATSTTNNMGIRNLACANILIEDCLIYGQNASISADGVRHATTTPITIKNTIINGFGGSGVLRGNWFYYNLYNVTIANCGIGYNDASGSGPERAVLRNVVCYGNSTDYANLQSGNNINYCADSDNTLATHGGANCVSNISDPFTDSNNITSSNRVFALSSGTVALVDAGIGTTDTNVLSTDIVGSNRDTDTCDIGAFEYATASLTYNVTYDGNGADGGSIPIDSTNYNENDTITVADNTGGLAKINHIFSGWNTALDGSGTSYVANNTFSMPSSNVTLYAVWVLDTTITLRQFGFRFFADDAIQGSATPIGAENTVVSVATGSKFRLRIGIATSLAESSTLAGLANNTAIDLGLLAQYCTSVQDPGQLITDYSGTVYDSINNEVLLFGGGHSAVMTDTIIAFDFATLEWVELYAPTPCSDMIESNYDNIKQSWESGPSGPYPRPVSRHTYNTNVFVPTTQEFLVTSRASGATLTCPPVPWPFTGVGKMAHYSRVTNTWAYSVAETFNNTDVNTRFGTSWHPLSSKVVAFGERYVYTYDPVTEVISTLLDMRNFSNADVDMVSGLNVIYAPDTDKFYIFVGSSEVYEITLDMNTPANSVFTKHTTTGTRSPSLNTLDYDSVNNIIGGGFVGGEFYYFNLSNYSWSNVTILGDAIQDAVHSCVTYSPNENVFLFMGGVYQTRKTYAYRFAGL